MGKTYLPSSLIVPLSFECKSAIAKLKEASIEEVKGILSGGFISRLDTHPPQNS
jgi:hypothetical protein